MNDDSVVWRDDFSVGFEPIDNQHKELVKMTQALFESCKNGATAADKAFLKTISQAGDYARVHFADEEKYLDQAGFPNLTEHKKKHVDFMDAVLKAIQEFEKGNTAPLDLARYLKNWLLNHIAKSDKEYAPYLAKCSN